MSMQFEYPATVLSATRVTVEGRTYANVFVGEQPTEQSMGETNGYSIRKIPADPAVFDQLGKLDGPRDIRLLMMLKQAGGGKAQPHIVGVVPSKQSASHTPKTA